MTSYNLGACSTSGSQVGTPTGAQQWDTSPRVTTDLSGGYGFTMGTGIIPALGIGRLGAGYQGKQLEKLMEENGIEVPQIEEGFF